MSQIVKKFIGNDQIGADQLRLENDQYLKARSQDGLSEIDTIRVNTSDQVELGNDLVPDADNTRALGTSGIEFSAVHTKELSTQGNLTLNPGTNAIVPIADGTIALGSPSLQYSNVYAVNVNSGVISASTNLLIEAGSSEVKIRAGSENIELVSTNNVVAPSLRFWDNGENFYAAIKAPDTLSANYTLILPVDDGAANQVLTTNGTGTLSWTSINDTGITELTGDVTAGPGNGSQAATIAANAVTNSKIAANAVTGAKLRLNNNEELRARNAANSADVNILKVNATDAIEVLGAAQVNGNITPDGNNTREVGSASANYQRVNTSEILGAAGVNLFADTGSTQIASGDETIDLISWNGSVAPSLRLFNAATSQSAAIKVPNALAGSYTLTLPPNDGNSGDVLQTDGSGVLTWVAPSGGSTPATETFVLDAGMITAQKVTLANTPVAGSVHFAVKGAPVLLEGASYDYTVSGADVNFENDLASGGASELIVGDIVQVKYMY